MHTKGEYFGVLMATSLLALLDDVTVILDDVAVLTKVATRKTAGVLGDDLALNAQQIAGVKPDRELPVVWAVMKGSFLNKAILVPAALAISALAPWAVTPLLMIGGAFLCYEGFEKIAHRFLRDPAEERTHEAKLVHALSNPAIDLVQLEKARIKGAIRTDFILSAEIIVITLGTVAEAALSTRILVLSAIAVVMTVGVYGLVAGVVKLDDAGLRLARVGSAGTRARLARLSGRAILATAPWLMKALSVAGTAAMFLVGGGILVHGIPSLHHAAGAILQPLAAAGGAGAAIEVAAGMTLNAIAGLLAGALVLAVVTTVQRARNPRPA